MRRGETRSGRGCQGGLIAVLLMLLSRALSGCFRIEMITLFLLPSTVIGKNVFQEAAG